MKVGAMSAMESHERFIRMSPYAANTPKGVQCHICPHNCIIQEGHHGICKTHFVAEGKLFTNAFGNPCSVHADPIEKKPLFHFLPGTLSYSIATAGCNLTCRNCQNWEISQQSPTDLQIIEMFPEDVVEAAISKSCKSIAFTYTEPTAFYEYTYETARFARNHGIKNLFISNGFINEKPLRDLCRYLDAANIDLKAFSDEIYRKLTGGSLQPVLNALKILKEEGVWVEITNLILPDWTDDLEMIRQMCEWLVINGFAETPLHFSRFHPLYKLSNLPVTPLETLMNARTVALETGLRFVYIGNVPDSMAEHTCCPVCKKIVIERHGYTIGMMNINKSACKFCKAGIAGVWD